MQFTKENAYALAEEYRRKFPFAPEGHDIIGTHIIAFLDMIETHNMFAKPHTGRPKTLDKAKQVEVLKSAASGTTIKYTRYTLEQMVDLGLLEKVAREKTGGRGRPKVDYVPTGRGKSYISLSKNWGL